MYVKVELEEQNCVNWRRLAIFNYTCFEIDSANKLTNFLHIYIDYESEISLFLYFDWSVLSLDPEIFSISFHVVDDNFPVFKPISNPNTKLVALILFGLKCKILLFIHLDSAQKLMEIRFALIIAAHTFLILVTKPMQRVVFVVFTLEILKCLRVV